MRFYRVVPALLVVLLFGGAPAYGATDTKATIGMPFDGKWGFRDDPSTIPPAHDRHFGGDWPADVYASEGTAVKPKIWSDDWRHAAILKIKETPRAACASGRLADGGKIVKVGVHIRGVEVGWVAYAHLDRVPAKLKAGTVVTPNTVLGTLRQYRNNSCYRVAHASGVHVHIEAWNRQNTSCYVRRSAGSSVGAGHRIGILGGKFNPECPANY